MAYSKVNNEPENMHVVTHLPIYLINLPKKGDSADFLSNILEDGRETGFVHDINDNANKIIDIDHLRKYHKNSLHARKL